MNPKRKLSPDRALFFLSLFLFTVLLGAWLEAKDIFPGPLLRLAKDGYTELTARVDKYQRRYYEPDRYAEISNGPVNSDYSDDRLTLLTYIGRENLNVEVVDRNGERVHHWLVDWYSSWPNPDHLDEHEKPKSGAGTHIHGLVLLENGDIIFNYEYLGAVRMDPCGNVVWRLPYRTHHSAHLDADGNVWLGGQLVHDAPIPSMPLYKPVYRDNTLLKISPDGEILRELSLLKILQGSQYEGLLYINTGNNIPNNTGEDPLHMNDVEIFPADMEPGHFRPGDIMVSLRNINAILIIDSATEQVKELITGPFVRQHDPDFIDGNTISIFDNYYVDQKDLLNSRILIYDAVNKDYRVHFQGNDRDGMSSWRMGKHQVLKNGHMVLAEAVRGRAFEIDADGHVVWNYINRVGDSHVGILEQADRLAPAFNRDFFEQVASRCK